MNDCSIPPRQRLNIKRSSNTKRGPRHHDRPRKQIVLTGHFCSSLDAILSVSCLSRRSMAPMVGEASPALSIRHSRVHKKEQQQSDDNQDHPHNRPNNQTGHISKGVGSMIAYYEYLRGYAQDNR